MACEARVISDDSHYPLGRNTFVNSQDSKTSSADIFRIFRKGKMTVLGKE